MLSIFGLNNARAAVLFEPFVGYSFIGNFTFVAPGTDLTGVGYGLRFGYKFTALSFALEYGLKNITVEGTDGPADSDGDVANLGVFVGYNFPVMLRAYAGYTVSSKLEFNSSSTELSGSGMKFGLGYTGIPYVVFDLEYAMYNYDEAEVFGVSQALTPEVKIDMISFNISLPLEF